MQIFFLNGLSRLLKNGHLPVKLHSSAPREYPREAGKSFFNRTLNKLSKFTDHEIMDVRDETHIIHSCYAAGWKNISAIFLGVRNIF